MSARDEIRQLMEQSERAGKPLTALRVVEVARNEEDWPSLWYHLWAVNVDDLAHEARLARAHRLMMSVHVTTSPGVTTRLLIHTQGTPGYQSLSKVIQTPDLAKQRLADLTMQIVRTRHSLSSFSKMLPGDLASDIDSLLEQAENKAADAATARSTAPAE